jgi:hypothetical protein
MTDHDYDQQQWGECPSGELRALACRLNNLRRRQLAFRIAQFGVLGLLLVAAGITAGRWTGTRRAPVLVARINCRECAAHFEAYHLHLIHKGTMDTSLAEQMRAHFQKCNRCRLAFAKQYPGVLIAIATDAAGLLAGVNHCPAGTLTSLLVAGSSR